MGLDEFERTKVIGKGSYGEVWLSKHKKDRKQYVLKKMNLQKASKRERKSAEQEAKLLSRLKHPNIVSYKDSFEAEDGFLYIAMQYCEGGDLYTKLKEQRGTSLEERQVVEWFVQIAMALQYMHERNILHRDLKTQNIFLTKSKIIKVGDLGIARVLDSSSDMATTLIGTPYYMSPELFSNKPYNHKSDVWALGCCVYEMATLKHAFNAKDMNSLVYKILRGRMPLMPKQYSPELVTMIRSMLHQDPDKRPSVNRILRDPYIKKNIAIFLEETKRNRRPSTSSSSRPSSRPGSAKEPRAVAAPSPGIPPQPPRPEVSKVTPSPMGLEAGEPPRFSHARKPSDAKVPDLDPIHEKSEDFSVASSSAGTAGTGSTQDTVVPQTVKEVNSRSPKREAHKKKRFLQNMARNVGSSGASGTDKSEDPGEASSKSASGSAEVRPPHRPLPVPKVEESAGLPHKREPLLDRAEKAEVKTSSSSTKSSASSSKEDNMGLDDATPRQSLPNLSARARRREKNPTANSLEHPNSARIHLRKPVERHMSDKVTKSERKEKEPVRGAAGMNRGMRQPSLNDSTSSDDSVKTQEEPAVQKKRESKEMNNFISLLDTTLHMNKEDYKSDDDDVLEKPRKSNGIVETPPSPPPPPPPEPEHPIHRSASMPSTDTLANTSRLMDRIRLLQKDCVHGVGYDLMKKAYDILDHIEEDEVEPRLVSLLGKEKFDEYAGKIWQLKFCEESLFMK